MSNIFGQIATGEISGSVTAKQCPAIASPGGVVLKAQRANAGNVYVGIAGVTVVDGTQDATSGFELDAGEQTPLIPVENLNELYIIGDNAGDDLTYMAFQGG